MALSQIGGVSSYTILNHKTPRDAFYSTGEMEDVANAVSHTAAALEGGNSFCEVFPGSPYPAEI